MLQDRFDKPQQTIIAHMEELYKDAQTDLLHYIQ